MKVNDYGSGSDNDNKEDLGSEEKLEEKISNEDKSTTGKDTDTDSIFQKQERREIKERSLHRFSEDSRDFLTKKTDKVKCEYKENAEIVHNLIKSSSIDIIEEEYVKNFID